MEPALQKYYEDSFSMLGTPGWGYLLEDLKDLRTAVNDLSTVAEPHQLYFRRGQLDVLDLILNRKAMFEKAWEQLNEETL